jgi:hypothetical protein
VAACTCRRHALEVSSRMGTKAKIRSRGWGMEWGGQGSGRDASTCDAISLRASAGGVIVALVAVQQLPLANANCTRARNVTRHFSSGGS